jgi:hypothetical protein
MARFLLVPASAGIPIVSDDEEDEGELEVGLYREQRASLLFDSDHLAE